MKKVLVFGNPLIEEDNMAVKLALELKLPSVEFVLCDSFSQLLDYNEEELVILDVVENLKKTTLIEDLDKLNLTKSLTTHDFDLGFNLKLMKALGRIKEFKIIGIPQKGDKEEIKKGIEKLLV